MTSALPDLTNRFSEKGESRMSRRRILLIALPAVLVLGVAAAAVGAAVWFARPKKVAVTLDVTGTRGLAIKLTADEDGKRRELTDTVPRKFDLEGYRVTYSLTSTEDAGEFRVKAAIGETGLASATSGNPPRKGIRGWVKSGWGGSFPSHWLESFYPDEERGWRVPPP
jgi:hypothetical protein